MLSRGGVCERASIDEVYLDLTEAAAARLLKDPPKLGSLPEEALKTHILGLPQVTAKLWVISCEHHLRYFYVDKNEEFFVSAVYKARLISLLLMMAPGG